MFFQTSADTVGMTKKGEITRIRTIRPGPTGVDPEDRASKMPRHDGDHQDAEPTRNNVVCILKARMKSLSQ